MTLRPCQDSLWVIGQLIIYIFINYLPICVALDAMMVAIRVHHGFSRFLHAYGVVISTPFYFVFEGL